jgi:fused signal recognition particle receptor
MFNRFRGLNPFRQSLEKTRQSVFTRVTNLFTTEVIDDALWDELEELLVRADLGTAITAEVVRRLRERVEREQLMQAPQLTAALRDELIAMLGGGESVPLADVASRPRVIEVVGVNGVGKTTSIAKLARFLEQSRRRVLIAAGDTFRAAAVEQLKIWGERLGVPVISHEYSADPGAVVYDAMEAGRARGVDDVIVDTAGRLHTKFNLMEELKKIQRVAQKVDPTAPHEVLLVLDATSGQNALLQARAFREAVGITGVILAKLDGTAKGGVAFAVRRELGVPIKFVGTGEKLDDFAPFDATAFVDALFEPE